MSSFGQTKKPPRPKPDYTLTGICRGGKVVEGRGTSKPPDEVRMAKWGKERQVLFVLRYMPSKKGWRALDIRNAQVFVQGTMAGRQYEVVRGAVRGTRIWPNLDAAIMYLLTVPEGKQLEMF